MLGEVIQSALTYADNTTSLPGLVFGEYWKFAALCHMHGYTFEPVQEKTDDGWTLTVFHITGYSLDPFHTKTKAREAKTEGKYPVLAVPGSYSDAQSWFGGAGLGKPMHLQLFDQGYDIWMGNNRGTQYSNVSDKFPDKNDDSFERWDFSWAELGLYDDRALIGKIQEMTKQEKVNYIGYSMGTTQMFYGLTQIEEEFYAANMNKFVALAPCVYFEHTEYDQYVNGYGEYRKLGINVLYGPNWEQHTKDICANMSKAWCKNAKSNWPGRQPQPLKSREWYTQITVEDRYQDYDPLYGDRQAQSPMISPGLNSIDKVPIHLIVGENDTHCSLEHAKRIQSEIGPAVRSLAVMPGFEHNTFGSATGKDYVQLVLDALAAEDSQVAYLQ